MIRKNQSNAGFSLVAVLMIMGVILLATMIISQARFRQQKMAKDLTTKQSYTDINQALLNGLVQEFHQSLKASATGACPQLDTLFPESPAASKKKLAGSDSTYYHTRTIVRNKGGSDTVVDAPPALMTGAIEECKQVLMPDASAPNRFRFCVQLDKDLKAPKSSIANARTAFAEIKVELIDLHNNGPIPCTTYSSSVKSTSDGSAGMAVTMMLFWENEAGAKKSKFSNKAFSYIANQN